MQESEDNESPDQSPSERLFTRGGKMILAGSIPVYLGLAAIIIYLWPEYAFLAWIPVLFTLSSAAFLLAHMRE